MSKGLSRDRDDMFTETLGDRESVEEFQRVRQEVEQGFEDDDATVDFNKTWGDVLNQGRVDTLREEIQNLRRTEPMPTDALPEDEEFRLATILLMKKGLIRAAEWVRMGVEKPVDETLAEVQQQLENL